MKTLFRTLCAFAVTIASWSGVSAQIPHLNSYPSAAAVIYLDFDGHNVSGTSWNFIGSFDCGGSGLNSSQITEVFDRVAEDYRPFNINVTTDSTVFLAAPIGHRIRVLLTVSSSWYGVAGGVAFVGSFLWSDDSPAFVFTALHGYNVKNIAEAAAHEAGHTLGLYHQSKYDAVCNKVTDYDPGVGTGEIGWAPIMGVGYYRNFTLWNNGPNTFGCSNMQSDLDVITSPINGFGYRVDDHGSFAGASIPVFTNHEFDVKGVIEKNTDQDMFRFIMPADGRFELNAVPYNVGAGNSGSDLDMQVTLLDQGQNILSVYNPGSLLNSVADTTLNSGTYYIKVEGKGNLYAPSYASLGSYSLLGKIDGGNGVVLPLHKLQLQVVQNKGVHQLDWEIVADELITDQAIEMSKDGGNFTPIAQQEKELRNFSYRPAQLSSTYQYRVRVNFADGKRYYSNIVSVRPDVSGPRPKLVSNLLISNTVAINSPGNFSFNIVDLNGREIAKGNLTNGLNNISVNSMLPGMYVIRFSDARQNWTNKFLRQ